MRINLHTHSTHSDGKLNLEELINKLYLDNVEVFALTDHDTISGILEAKELSLKYGIKMINGIEISTRINDLDIPFLNSEIHTFHILGLDFDYNKLKKEYDEIEKNKLNKLKLLNENLISEGFKIPIIKNLKKRAQIADELIINGYAKTIEEAFENIINKRYYRWSDNINIKKVIQIIHNSGGKLIWAHPFEILENITKFHLNEDQIDFIAAKLKKLGVDGIEVYYQKYNEKQLDFLKSIQTKYNFIASVGTDYHGKDSQRVTYMEIDYKLILGGLL